MSTTLTKVTHQNIENRLEATCPTIGSSDMPTLLGISPFKGATRYALWQRLVRGVRDSKKPSTAMRIGNALEPLIGELYEETTTRHADPNGNTVYYNPELPHDHATPDFLIEHHPEAVLEAKSVGVFWAKDWKEGVPPHVVVQCHHQMRVMELDYVEVGVIIGGRSFETYSVLRDSEILCQMKEAHEQFVKDFLVPRTPPPVTDEDLPVLKIAYPEAIPEKVLELDDPILVQYWDTMARCDAEIKSHNKIKDVQKAEVQRVMEDAEVLRLGNGAEFLWKNTKQGRRFSRGKGGE